MSRHIRRRGTDAYHEQDGASPQHPRWEPVRGLPAYPPRCHRLGRASPDRRPFLDPAHSRFQPGLPTRRRGSVAPRIRQRDARVNARLGPARRPTPQRRTRPHHQPARSACPGRSPPGSARCAAWAMSSPYLLSFARVPSAAGRRAGRQAGGRGRRAASDDSAARDAGGQSTMCAYTPRPRVCPMTRRRHGLLSVRVRATNPRRARDESAGRLGLGVKIYDVIR